MPWIKVWIHFVWSTKNREPYLNDGIRGMLFNHIEQNARKKKIFIDTIGGFTDHVHSLISLGGSQSLREIMQLIKGESSNWINKNGLVSPHFGWPDEYFAASVSASNLPAVRKYILNQEAHHSTFSFDDEFEVFLKRAGFQKFKDGWK
ncbi:MAG TPA: IS200/IS605 family transposase [Pyrinomonadaceae bacterium]|nr:IS200/IS605 family transposase [Pyrinomonadaceae bacterium]